MKRPEYVAAAAAVYRAAAEGRPAPEQLLHDLQAVFSRSGFTDGYLTGKRGAPMFGIRSREDVTAAESGVLRRLARLYEKEQPRIPVRFALSVPAQGSCTLTAADEDGHTVTVSGAPAEPARTAPLREEYAAGQLQKTGGTPYRADAVTCAAAPGVTLSAGALNALRRTALEQLSLAREAGYQKPFDPARIPDFRPAAAHPARPVLAVRLADAAQLAAALAAPDTADYWILPLALIQKAAALPPAFGAEIPRGTFGPQQPLLDALCLAKEKGARFALCGQAGAVGLALRAGLPPVAGFGCNLSNRHAADEAAARGVKAMLWSFELPPAEIPRQAPIPAGLFVYGRQPLMLTRNCPVSAARGCAGCGEHGQLTDRTGTVFPVMCSGGCSELLNAHILYMADRRDRLPPADFWYLHMTDESPALCMETVRQYRTGGPARAGITRGIYGRSGV